MLIDVWDGKPLQVKSIQFNTGLRPAVKQCKNNTNKVLFVQNFSKHDCKVLYRPQAMSVCVADLIQGC